ncbi:MAG: DNA-binding transcriptional LysR family regulator [Paracoccaceae bacterium]|jgi:DNA-binding transcriptional LysR family regulator
MIDQLRAMAIFQAVVEAGSFRAAARQLNLSPSVVSHHIAQLEDQLGTALLYRSTRRLSLTDAGGDLLAASADMTAAATRGLNAIRARAGRPSGALRVAATGAVFEQPPFADHLAEFARDHPDVRLSLSFSDLKIDLIGSAYDVALRIGWLEDSQYKARALAQLPRVLVAAPDYVAKRALPKRIEDLADWDWIKLAQMPIARQLSNAQGEVPALSPPIAVEVDSVAALVRFACLGLGVAAIPRQLARDQIADGRLVTLVPNWPLMAATVFAVWPGNAADDSLALYFVRDMARRLVSA